MSKKNAIKVLVITFISIFIIYFSFINIVGRVYNNTIFLRNQFFYIGDNSYSIIIYYNDKSYSDIPKVWLSYKNEYGNNVEQTKYVSKGELINIKGKKLKCKINCENTFDAEIYKNSILIFKSDGNETSTEVKYDDD